MRDFREGLFFFYLGRVDQLSHMFWSAMDPRHPGFQPDSPHAGTIPATYREMDRVLGRVLEEVDDRTTLLVMSDHGFAPFYRAFHLNTWLRRQGYITLLQGSEEGMLRNVDWSRTRAYGFGFNGLYTQPLWQGAPGDRPQGSGRGGASPGDHDPAAGVARSGIRRGGGGPGPPAGLDLQWPTAAGGPRLVLGYQRGYRASWGNHPGQVSRPGAGGTISTSGAGTT